MFGIPDEHINNLIAHGEIDNPYASLVEEMGELQAVLGKYIGDRIDWETARLRVREEMAHVLVSMNLAARQIVIDELDIHAEIESKAIKAKWDTSNYNW